ncbi:MAG: endonuclease/exonuclease/phosphatase family protein [Deltaproteobacteria bacterium]|nr:endonuclease/exonuclease/phosphatase family protein [Deltaproteobacteria bacterium]
MAGTRRAVWALAIAVALAGCGDNLRAVADGAVVDGRVVDGPAADAWPEFDAPLADAPVDGVLVDATADGAIADAAADGAIADAGPDAVIVDAGPDAVIVDGGPDAVIVDGGPDATLSDAGIVRLRIAAANVTSGNLQAYEAPGIRILRALGPDVAMLQELNYASNTDADLRSFIDQAFGPTYVYFRGTGQIPNGVASRYPIVSAGSWIDPAVSNRGFVWARVDVPGPVDVWAVSVHFLTTSAAKRDIEAVALRDFITANVPAADYLVIAGDFNTDTRTEACVTTLSAVVSTAAPYPTDQNANHNTNGNRNKPYDWVMADADLDPLRIPTSIGASTYPDGLVFDTRVYTPLTEVPPALDTDSAATNMQHMAVVKDFALPP